MTKKKPPEPPKEKPPVRWVHREGGRALQYNMGNDRWVDAPVVHFPKSEDGSR